MPEKKRSLQGIPPRDRWTTIEYPLRGGGTKRVEVPFDAEEVSVLREGMAVNGRLIGKGTRSSGVEREYWVTGGQLFPDETTLVDRPLTVRRLQRSSLSAGNLLSTLHPSERRQPGMGETIRELEGMRDLPQKMHEYEEE
jgi:hypothetical protein